MIKTTVPGITVGVKRIGGGNSYSYGLEVVSD